MKFNISLFRSWKKYYLGFIIENNILNNFRNWKSFNLAFKPHKKLISLLFTILKLLIKLIIIVILHLELSLLRRPTMHEKFFSPHTSTFRLFSITNQSIHQSIHKKYTGRSWRSIFFIKFSINRLKRVKYINKYI